METLSGLPGVTEIDSGLDLRVADLRGAYLTDANLGGANLRGVNLQKAKCDDGTRWPAGFAYLAGFDYKAAGAIHVDDLPADELPQCAD